MRISPALSVMLVVMLAACGRLPAGTSDGDSASESADATHSSDTSGAEIFDVGTDGSEHSCGGFSIVPTYVAYNLMFVVDVSSSMLETWDHDEDPMTPEVSRWQTARTLLEQVIPEIDTQVRLGLQRAPSSEACPGATLQAPNCTDADVCLVESTPEVAVGDLHGEPILASLPDGSASPLEIVGGSPIRAAFVSARDMLLAQPEREQTVNVSGIVLITDGGANCTEPGLPGAVEVFDQDLEALVAESHLVHGIPTVVVGVDVDAQQPSLPAQPDSPAVDTYAALNALALAGGLPWYRGTEPRKFFDVREIDDLLLVIEPQADTVTECTVDLTTSPEGAPEPSQIPLVVIEMDGQDVPFVLDCANENGWTWIEEGKILSFCGSFCEDFKTGMGAVDIVYGCPPI